MTDIPDWAKDLASRVIDASVTSGPTNAIAEALVNTALMARKNSRIAGLREAAEIAGEYEMLWSNPSPDPGRPTRMGAGKEIKFAIRAAADKLEGS